MDSSLECFMHLRTGAIQCLDAGEPLARTFRDYDPLNRILQHEPTSEWKLVGYVVTQDAGVAQSQDRTMMLHAQRILNRRERYNYRVVDSNGVGIDVGEKVEWLMHGATLTVPSQPSPYTVHLYKPFR